MTPAEKPCSGWQAFLPPPSSFSFFLQTPTSFLYCFKPQDNKLRRKCCQTVSGKVCGGRWTSAPQGLLLPLQISPETSVLRLHNWGWGAGLRTPKWWCLVEPLTISSLFWSLCPSPPLPQPQWPEPAAQGLRHGGLLLLGAPCWVPTSSSLSKELFSSF